MASATKTHTVSISDRLGDNWTTTDIAWQGVEYEPDEDPYVEAAILWGDGFAYDRASSGRAQLTGVLNLNLFARPGTGLGTLYGYADTLRDLFTEVTVDAVRFTVPSGPREVTGNSTDRVQVNVSCPFTVEDTV